jgi:hypothetical protein
MVAVGVSVWQAVKARHMTSEFSESKYIALTVFSMAQGFVTGIPVAAVVKDIPVGRYPGRPMTETNLGPILIFLLLHYQHSPIVIFDLLCCVTSAFYMVLTFLIFILCTVILLLIFLPKIILQRRYSGLSKGEQRKLMSLAISVGQKMTSSVDLRKDSTSFGVPSPSAANAFIIHANAKREESSQYVSDLTPAEFRESNLTMSKLDYEKEFFDNSNSSVSKECKTATDKKVVTPIQEEEVSGIDATLLFRQMLALTKSDDSNGSVKDFLELIDSSKLRPDEQASWKEAKALLATQESAR